MAMFLLISAMRATRRAAAVLLLGACATHPPQPLPFGGAAVPVAWVEPAPAGPAGDDPVRWWRQFGDAQMTGLIEAALRANPDVNAAEASLRRARALRDVSVAAALPLLGGSVSAQRTRDRGTTGNLFDAAFDAGWETDVFGALRHGAQASEAQARAAQASLASVRVSLAAEVAVDYINLRAAQQRLALTADSVEQQRQSLQLAQWRERAGLASTLDVLQARSALEQTQAQQPVLQGTVAQLAHALAVLTGDAPEALQRLQRERGPIPRAPAAIAVAIPAQVLRQRPDVAVAEHQVGVAAEQVAEADAQRHPSVQLRASVQWSALTLGTLGSGDALRSLTAGLTQPLLDHGQRNAQLEAAQAAFDASQQSYRGAVLAALRDVEDALSSLGSTTERLQRLHATTDAAGAAAQLARQRYASGLVDFQVVLDTQRTLLAAQDGAAAAEGDVATAQVRLYKALGGAWTTKESAQ